MIAIVNIANLQYWAGHRQACQARSPGPPEHEQTTLCQLNVWHRLQTSNQAP